MPPLSTSQFTSENLLSDIFGVLSSHRAALTSLPILPTSPLVSSFSSTNSKDTTASSLPTNLPSTGLGLDTTFSLFKDTLLPNLANQNASRYFGFVTGGTTDGAWMGQLLATGWDRHVQVNLEADPLPTIIEALSLHFVLTLLSPRSPSSQPLDGPSPLHSRFPARTITTGATSANILGLALGRDWVISHIKRSEGPSFKLSSESSLKFDGTEKEEIWSVAEKGFGGVEIDVYCAGAHASIKKAAAMVGIGRGNVIEVVGSESGAYEWNFHLGELERKMKESKENGRGCIVSPSFGEVNTGGFTADIPKVRELCDRYDAWMHIDAAFGAFAALMPEDFPGVFQGLASADSVTIDGHKWLNVPYDCGLSFSRSLPLLQSICGPGLGRVGPAYLSQSSSNSPSAVDQLTSTSDLDPTSMAQLARAWPSHLNTNIENSRAFRAAPLYASLLSLGRDGYEDIVRRNISFARRIEEWIREGEGRHWYRSLTPLPTKEAVSTSAAAFKVLNVVLFAPRRDAPVDSATEMVRRINDSRKMYVTGTTYRGEQAARLAVSNWMTGLDHGQGANHDIDQVINVLGGIMKQQPC